jgi:ElaB/YqjD/DUF883 family membrane-anchored ribosome-binding protein
MMVIPNKYVLQQIEQYKYQFIELDKKALEWKTRLRNVIEFYDNVFNNVQTDEREQVREARDRIKSALKEFDTLINADNLSMITHHIKQAIELY